MIVHPSYRVATVKTLRQKLQALAVINIYTPDESSLHVNSVERSPLVVANSVVTRGFPKNSRIERNREHFIYNVSLPIYGTTMEEHCVHGLFVCSLTCLD